MRTHVTIAGGGIGAAESLIALRDLAGDRVRLTVVAPDTHLLLRPLTTVEPFTGARPPRYPLAELTARLDADLVRDRAANVDAGRRVLYTATGRALPYGHLIIAVGARPTAPYEHAVTFARERGDGPFTEVLDAVAAGEARSVAFVLAPGTSWSLPLYELALMTARHARAHARETDLLLVTPEEAPLQLFGPHAAEPVRELLDEAGVAFHGGVYAADVGADGTIALRPGHEELRADRVVTLPVPEGPWMPGLPHDDAGFLPIDDHTRVLGVEHVHAVGDATAFPVKQGGLATQMADAAAEWIAAAAGVPLEPQPFRPVLRGKLLTGAGAEYLTSRLAGGAGEGEASHLALWHPPDKVTGRHLAPWMARFDGERDRPPRGPAVDVERTLPLDLDPYDPTPAMR